MTVVKKYIKHIDFLNALKVTVFSSANPAFPQSSISNLVTTQI